MIFFFLLFYNEVALWKFNEDYEFYFHNIYWQEFEVLQGSPVS